MTIRCGNSTFPRQVNSAFNLVWVQYNAYGHPASQSLLWIYIVLSILGNALVIVWRCCRLRDSASRTVSALIISLAFSGFVYGIHLLLFEGTFLHCKQSADIFISELCQAAGFFFVTGGIATYCNTTLIAFYFCVAVLDCNCLSISRKTADRLVFVAIAVIWAVASGLGFWYTFHFYGYRDIPPYGSFADWSRCSPITWGVESSSQGDAKVTHNVSFSFGAAVTGVGFVCYVIVGVKLCCICCTRRSGYESMSDSPIKRLGMTGILLQVVAAFNLISWIPLLVRHIILMKCGQEDLEHCSETIVTNATIIGIAAQVQFAIDPLIYTLSSKEFFARFCRRCHIHFQVLSSVESGDGHHETLTTSAFDTLSSERRTYVATENEFKSSDSEM